MANNNLRDRLLKATTLEHTAVLETSKIYNEKDVVPTAIPALNIAYSADILGGISPGLTVWAGPSKHFKTLFCLISASAYLAKYPDAGRRWHRPRAPSPALTLAAPAPEPSQKRVRLSKL